MQSIQATRDLPLVTVVTPSYNQGRFIRETIESVLSQDYPHIEYMVLDGGSTDETTAILKSYDGRFFWISEPDRGQAHAINKGWQRARGEILAWLNSDDVYLPGAIRRAVDYLSRNPHFGMVYGEGHHMAVDGRVIERYPTEPFNPERLIDTCYICQPATFIRRNVIEEIGFLDESLNFCMDYDLWIRISRKYALGYMPQYLAQTRFYSESKTLGQRVAVHREALRMLHRHYGFVPLTWAYGYAKALLERRVNRQGDRQKKVLRLSQMVICCSIFLQYNYRVPLQAIRRWERAFKSMRRSS
ncbi:MAG: glycosyltransferase [Nitrospiraceae bacterium]